MIAKAYEWLRVAYPQNPSSDVVTARTTTVARLVDSLQESNDLQMLAHLCTGAILGLHGRYADDSELVKSLVDSIRSAQSAFPSGIKENAQELQVVSALTIGELITRTDDIENAMPEIAAAMLLALSECRPVTSLHHLATVHSELIEVARTTLEQAALAARKRVTPSADEIDALRETPSDVATMWQSVQEAFTELISAFRREAAKDREELELLWWMFNGFSVKLAKPVKELSIEAAAIACGAEIAGRTLLPPSNAVAAMAEDMTNRQRTAKQLADVAFEQTLAKWKNGIAECLVPESFLAQQFAKAHPAVFPLTWMALRLKESQIPAKWQDEFAGKTGWDKTTKIPHSRLARQVLYEHSCLRMIDSYSVEDDK